MTIYNAQEDLVCVFGLYGVITDLGSLHPHVYMVVNDIGSCGSRSHSVATKNAELDYNMFV